ncbi:hypothetical protein H112_03612 [Trichophyton rubrum D6]|uniref:DUF1989 domain-containing protein n=5 Tax=Trichophyton TaxID=5550 RepID=A0A178EYV3_TRIRU|nr:uncharacterized protein TERG_04936 [Trichophyton rubrum CBS 118892]EZF23769.1 hypothetical protein H100_03618 [Trichophyton rubrum MR850]EZF42785.1 hypothetical protein H102_03611 [Trichophyton rubrum CBS 100081]EZF53452.1 hypothetical protein H103_03621 [Trichophyton rubrum CBS 288.86]EZF64067.1 hypothetical protein H104_03607 [Trichophyton rubrum CBS 289.86]EZF74658.1 hypothetical protein H105_03635 [Trichophyton soudanense CBS 452.61]EZF85359.1 hypothetical protein H110_03620 [Trichophy
MTPPPPPAYDAPADSPIYANKELYSRIANCPSRTLQDYSLIRPRSAHAWIVRAGQVCRITAPQGAQVGDLNIWNAHNPRERFWASRTRQLHQSHVSTFDRLWSCLPYMRPLVTITADTLSTYGVDSSGGRVHDLLGTRCDPYIHHLMTGESDDFHCHSNLVRAVAQYGLVESDVHDVLNVFQVTGLDSKGRYFMGTSPAKIGDYFEFFAEQDVLCALSVCSGGDLSQWGWKGSEQMGDTTKPLGVEVYSLDDKAVLEGWRPLEPSAYTGLHGLRMPAREQDGLAGV